MLRRSIFCTLLGRCAEQPSTHLMGEGGGECLWLYNINFGELSVVQVRCNRPIGKLVKTSCAKSIQHLRLCLIAFTQGNARPAHHSALIAAVYNFKNFSHMFCVYFGIWSPAQQRQRLQCQNDNGQIVNAFTI